MAFISSSMKVCSSSGDILVIAVFSSLLCPRHYNVFSSKAKKNMSPEKFVAGTKAEAPEGDRSDSRNKTKGKNQNEGKEKFLKKNPKTQGN